MAARHHAGESRERAVAKPLRWGLAAAALVASMPGGDLLAQDAGAPVCGDHACSAVESCGSCPVDCGPCAGSDAGAPSCGDRTCGPRESCLTCAADCGPCPFQDAGIPRCGDRACGTGESCMSCPADCGSCAVPTLRPAPRTPRRPRNRPPVIPTPPSMAARRFVKSP